MYVVALWPKIGSKLAAKNNSEVADVQVTLRTNMQHYITVNELHVADVSGSTAPQTVSMIGSDGNSPFWHLTHFWHSTVRVSEQLY